jgi:biotin transport system permease protein
VLLFALASPLPLTVAALIVATLTATGGPRFAAHALRMLRPLIPFVVVIALWHLWLRDPAGVPIILRMITAVAAANLVTMTTRLSDMITVLERLMRPFAGLVPPRALALAIALTIRFIPVMLDRAAQISESWRARSPRRPGWRVLHHHGGAGRCRPCGRGPARKRRRLERILFTLIQIEGNPGQALPVYVAVAVHRPNPIERNTPQVAPHQCHNVLAPAQSAV